MVAPTRVTVPSSTCGRNASCCAFVKRWISSTNSIVRLRFMRRRSRAAATISRISFTPPSTALNPTNSAPVRFATMRARVVLPVPGGPHRMSEGTWSASMARRSAVPGPSTCSCPAKSSRRRGRIRSASGLPEASCSAARSNRSMQTPYIMSAMDGHPCPVPKRVGIVHKVSSAEASETALYVRQFLESRKIEAIVDETEVGRTADLVVVLGGDGTLIHAAALLGGRPVPSSA